MNDKRILFGMIFSLLCSILLSGQPAFTGTSSSEWSNPANWSGGLLPGGGLQVTISPPAAHWPVYYGNITLGLQCGSISLEHGTVMTVTGNLIIPAGNAVNVHPTAELKVNGAIIR